MSLPPKDPNAVDFYHIVWCSEDGTNDASASDTGELQGATISTSGWTVTGITADSNTTAAVSMRGITYAVNTVATIVLSSGTAGTDYELLNRIDTSDGRILDKTITVRVRQQ